MNESTEVESNTSIMWENSREKIYVMVNYYYYILLSAFDEWTESGRKSEMRKATETMKNENSSQCERRKRKGNIKYMDIGGATVRQTEITSHKCEGWGLNEWQKRRSSVCACMRLA